MRHCVKCQIDTERYKDGSCKPCRVAYSATYRVVNPEKAKASKAAYRAAHPDVEKAGGVAYRLANKEKIKSASAARHKANPEKSRAHCAAYHAAHTEARKVYNAAYRAANPEREKARFAAYRIANIDADRIKSQNRRARRKLNGGILSKGLAAKLFKLQRGKCPCCGLMLGSDYHLDHIIPLARGGANEDVNMQLLRSTCNLQKGAKSPIAFMQSRGFLL